jgi:hypothetical protein
MHSKNLVIELCTTILIRALFAVLSGEGPNELMPLGKYLGDWTNELGDDKYSYDHTWIVEFVRVDRNVTDIS